MNYKRFFIYKYCKMKLSKDVIDVMNRYHLDSCVKYRVKRKSVKTYNIYVIIIIFVLVLILFKKLIFL